MKKSIISLLLFFLSLSVFAQEKQIQKLINQYGISGIQLVCIKGDTVERFNLGTIAKGSDKKVTANTIFEAASLSKCVFAYTVLRLYDRGIISLDTPLLIYTGPYDRFDSADPRYSKITARMVLRHTTGLPNWGDDKVAKLIFPPDSTYSYSGEGFQFLQRAVEKRTGKTLNELAQTEVFTPLGMEHSGYTWSEKFDTLSAFGNSPDAINNHKDQRAAASLLTCANDYAIFIQALMEGKGLKPATQQMMFTKQSAGNWFQHRVTEANKHIGWGLGIGLQENESGLWIWQWGDNGDFKGFCIANPKKKEVLIYLTHSGWGLHISTDLLNIFFPRQTWWANNWIGYEFYEKKNMMSFWNQLEIQGYDQAAKIAAGLKQKDSSFLLPESDVNDLGYILLGRDRKKEAINIFKFNVAEHPASPNANESLGEGYEANSETPLALQYYKKTLVLEPGNRDAAYRIKNLEAKK